ncbi:MAG: LamG domain-containing protein, partial [Flavobacteriaceae bacterium]|nr:LamG domain-containing protein [Bacteroidia bacterium]NNL61992.1 LamG domain-containing protein [Flavobacteriaceae bacterium]
MKSIINSIYFLTFLSFAQPCDLGYELNGTNDYITIPNTTNINANNTAVATRTIETWFKVDDATPRQVIFEEGAQVNAILLYVEAERVYCGGFRGNGGSSEFFRSANNSILDDTWYHVALVISTSGGTTTFDWYLDGNHEDSQTAFTIPKHTGDINLGRNGGNMRYPNCAT